MKKTKSVYKQEKRKSVFKQEKTKSVYKQKKTKSVKNHEKTKKCVHCTTLRLVTPRKFILGLSAEGQQGPSCTKYLQYYLVQ